MNRNGTDSDRLGRSAEDYLEAIGMLSKPDGSAQPRAIAEHLGVRMPSVTAALKKLAAEGLITYAPYAPVQLTDQGRAYAERVITAHRTLHRFMREVAGLSEARAEQAACQMEHFLTEAEIAAIARRLP
ncbi:MAG: metal-dependent transcriptional regulator [Akkermansia sp.]|nr:metal-dependent transcriptional regulator [Akkermansia sp.]